MCLAAERPARFVGVFGIPKTSSNKNNMFVSGVKAEEIGTGRILAGSRDVWRVFLEILPSQKSEEKR